MTIISQKLKSRRGASLILAMVFMLMCLFVGGSVLAAATANGGRVADMTSNQQTYLSQRSAALLMADMLEGDGNSNLQLTIKKVSVPSGDGTSENITITYSLPNLSAGQTYNTLQRILVENAVRKYRIAQGLGNSEPDNEGCYNFSFTGVNNDHYAINSPLYGPNNASGSFTVTTTAQNSSIQPESTIVYFESPALVGNTPLESEHFDMLFHFGAGTQVSLHVNATYSEGKPVEVIQGTTTTTTTTTVIRWDDPVIEKGGYQNETATSEANPS